MFKKRFGLIALLLCIVLTVGFSAINADATSTVVMAIEGIIVDGNLVKFSGFNGLGVDTGLAATNVVKSNFAAGAAPTVNDDIDLGYTVGSRWLDLTNDKSYVCLDSTDGAAVWHLDVVGPGTSTDHAIVRWDGVSGRTTLNSAVTISDAGVVAGGEWQGTVISPVYGGTGIANNVASTWTISGNFATTITVTNVTGVTLPTAGTLCVNTGTPETTFQIDDDNTGPKLKNSAGEMQVRNAADDGYADLRALAFYGDGSNLTDVGAAAASALTYSAKAAENISKGEVVYISGASGQLPEVNLADNTNAAKHNPCGVAAETKTTGQTILIRLQGELTSLDTSGFVNGDLLFLSTAGALTKTMPTSGAMEPLARCSYSHVSAGKIVLMYHGPHGLFAASADDLVVRLGDDVGGNTLKIKNYSNVQVISFDSYGRIWHTVTSTVVTGDITGLRTIVTCSAASGGDAITGQNTRAIYAQVVVAASKHAGLLQAGLFTASVVAGNVTAYNIHVLCAHYSSGATTIIGGDLYVGYLRSQTREDNARAVAGYDALLALQNEAVQGDGGTIDAAIRIFETNISGSVIAFTYGIDMIDTGITTDIRLSAGSTIVDDATSGITLVPIAGYVNVAEIRAIGAAGLKLYEDGGNGLYIEDTGKVHFNNDIYAYGASGGAYKELQFVASANNQSSILRITPTGTPTLDDHGMTNVGGGIRIDGESDYSPRAFIGVEVGGDFVISTVGDAGIRFMPNEATHMYLDKDGNLYIGDGTWTNYTYITAAGNISLEGAATFTGAIIGNATTCTTASAGDAAVDFFGAGVDAVTDTTECTDIEGTLLAIAGGVLNVTIPEDHVTPTMLKDDNAPADEDFYCYELTGTTGHWYSRVEVGIGVATSITDNLIVEADLSEVTGAPTDEDILTYEHDTVNFEWHTKAELSIASSGANTDITSILNVALYVGRDADNRISWAVDDTLTITIAGNTHSIVDIETGVGDNDSLVTQGYVDDVAGGANVALSNLAGVAINTSLLPDAADAHDLGGVADAEWAIIYLGTYGTVYFGVGQTEYIAETAVNALEIVASDGVTFSDEIWTTNIVGRDTDNYLSWSVDDSLAIKIGGVAYAIVSISTGIGDNDKLVTQGYADDIAGGATIELDNLGVVAINTSLISDTADTDDLGSVAKEWRSIFVGTVGKVYFGLSQEISLEVTDANTLYITASANVSLSSGLIVAGTVALAANNITMTGSIGVTGSRVTKLWTADLEVTNAIVAPGLVSLANGDITLQPNGTGTTIVYAPAFVVTTKAGVATLTEAEAGTVFVSAAGAYTITLPTAVGSTGLTYTITKTDANFNLITLDANGAQTFNYENSSSAPTLTYIRLNTLGAEVTITSDGTNWQVSNEQLGQVPYAHIYLNNRTQEDFKTSLRSRISFDTAATDIGSISDVSSWITGDATATSANHLIDATTDPFTADMLGCEVKNVDDTTYAHISAVNTAEDVTITADIFENGEEYLINHAKITIPIPGLYQVEYRLYIKNTVAAQQYNIYVSQDFTGDLDAYAAYTVIAGKYLTLQSSVLYPLTATDIIELRNMPYDAAGDTSDVWGAANSGYTYLKVKLISKD